MERDNRANRYSPEVRERAVRMVLDGVRQHESCWAAIVSISSKIGCAPRALNEWVKKVDSDTGQHWGNAEEYRKYLTLVSKGRRVIYDSDVSLPWDQAPFIKGRLR